MQYKRINLAVNKYLALNSKAILDLLSKNPNCSTVNMKAKPPGGAAAALASPIAGCELKITTATATPSVVTLVANATQPTVKELRSMGLLDSTFNDLLPLRTDNIVQTTDATGAVIEASAGFAVQITRECVVHSGAVTTTKAYLACTDPTGASGYYDLKSLVFNNQPFSDENIYTSRGINLLYMVLNAIGPDGLIAAPGLAKVVNSAGSDITNTFPLLSINRKESDYLLNPLTDATGKGIPNILAIRAGYGSSYYENIMQLDGGTSPTNDWDFAGFSLNDVNQVEASSIKTKNLLSDGITAKNVTADTMNAVSIAASGPITADTLKTNGAISASGLTTRGGAIDTGTLTASGAISGNTLKATGAATAGSVQSSGDINSDKDITSKETVSGKFFKFLTTVGLGDPCNIMNAIGLNNASFDQLLTCHPVTKQWVTVAKGDTGPQGIQGDRGPPGDKGPMGPADNTLGRIFTSIDKNTRTTPFSCDNNTAVLVSADVNDLGKWEKPSYLAECNSDNNWSVTARHNTTVATGIWAILRKDAYGYVGRVKVDPNSGVSTNYSCDSTVPVIQEMSSTFQATGMASAWCETNNTWSIVNQASYLPSYWVFLDKNKSGYVYRFSSGDVRNYDVSLGERCDQYIPVLSGIHVYDANKWESVRYVSYCDTYGYWRVSLSHPTSYVKASWALIRHPNR